MKIALNQLAQFAPGLSKDSLPRLLDALNTTIEQYDISTLRRVRYFMTQASFETLGFTKWIENLSYSTPERLVAVFPKRFTLTPYAEGQGRPDPGKGKAFAPDFVRNPAALANQVYGNRMGNGDFASGEGWTYIGRGAFHLTGKENYRLASMSIYKDLRFVIKPELVQEYPDGCLTAGWFWDSNKLNALADSDSFTQVTTIVNGSAVTVPERLVVLRKANAVFTELV